MELNSEEGLYCSFFGFSYLSQFLFNFSLSLMVFPLVALKLLSEIIECEVCTPPDVLHKEKNVVYPFHVFEKGSTSDTSNESSATSFEPILADGKNAMKLNLLYREFPEYFVWSSSDKFWALRQRRCTVGRVSSNRRRTILS
ncbi:uncharacterized protein LOC107784450 isoform X9 [Nicotiana tabacum]|uniref:Uncharacterized protein LOC107784450 isoform X9 n=1 Tax=Nicotiana tabacum TaxID=4097 RepID=A0AC58RLE4_TOBAC